MRSLYVFSLRYGGEEAEILGFVCEIWFFA